MNNQLSEHFSLDEFTRSFAATRLGIDNTPPVEAVSNLQCLCQEVLEPLRRHARRPVVISSGYRSRQLNQAVGGATRSQHCKGEAADIHIPDIRTGHEWFHYIATHLPFDQLIWEYVGTAAWIHVSHRRRHADNRHQILAKGMAASPKSSPKGKDLPSGRK
jgi:zinc D-Ala-D-Ala carboxypeptidase